VSQPLVWVTRAQPGAAATAERLRTLGYEPLVAPLLEVRALGETPIDLTGVAALAFTSANGLAALAVRSAERRIPVFAVGGATAEAARAAGFGSVVSAEGDVAALARVIAGRAPFAGEILHPGAAEPAGDLIGALAGLGVAARALAVYETAPRPPDEATAARVGDLAAVLLHSPKAARALAEHLARKPAPKLAALCLSEAVAAPLRGGALAAVSVAAEPTEAALLALLGEGAAAR
jgi:uroporphyrinogen-III synthase